MGAGAIFLLFVLLVFAVIAVGALSAIRAGLWARDTAPPARQPGEEPRESHGRRPRHVVTEGEGEARFDVSGRDRNPAKR